MLLHPPNPHFCLFLPLIQSVLTGAWNGGSQLSYHDLPAIGNVFYQRAGWTCTREAPGYPRQPPFIQEWLRLNSCLNYNGRLPPTVTISCHLSIISSIQLPVCNIVVKFANLELSDWMFTHSTLERVDAEWKGSKTIKH